MKKSIRSILIAGFTVLSLANVQAAKSFEGVITYDIKIDNSAGTIPQEEMSMFEGSQMIISMKEGLSKVQMDLGPQQVTTIANKKENYMMQLFNLMGNKVAVKSNLDSLMKAGKAEADKPVFKYDSETKTIAGYLCKKAEMTVTDKKTGEKVTSVVYYTEDIPVTEYNTSMQGIKGYPLQFEVHKSGIVMTMTAKTVDKKTLTNADFAIPAGYTQMTADQMKAMMQQMQSGH